MHFYLIDDDITVIKILQKIVEKDLSDDVVGTSTQPEKALTEIPLLDIDIVLVDLLMPKLNGVQLVKKLHQQHPHLKFIMISQVNDGDLRQEAYEAGITFFVGKPINLIEVQTVINNVKHSIEMANQLASIQNLLSPATESNKTTIPKTPNYKEKIDHLLTTLGIHSELGADYIVTICLFMLEEQQTFNTLDFKTLLDIDTHEKRILFQRMRRAIKKGLKNLAILAQSDNSNDILIEHANLLYGYKQLYQEMQFQKGQSTYGGKVSLKKFFDGIYAEITR